MLRGGYYRYKVAELVNYMNACNIDMVGSRRQNYLEKHWTKRDAFVYMGCDESQYWNQRQCWAGWFVLKKCSKTVQLVNEWLSFAQDERIITDNANTCGMNNFEGFVENRHDQSILSLLMKKYNIEIIENLPIPDFFVYHHTMQTSIRAIKKELRQRRIKQIKNFWKNKDYKGIYYIERDRVTGTVWVQRLLRKRGK